jgi:hypothetical protein
VVGGAMQAATSARADAQHSAAGYNCFFLLSNELF